jgi:hypothetical protein
VSQDRDRRQRRLGTVVADIVWPAFGTGLTVLVITSPARTGEND